MKAALKTLRLNCNLRILDRAFSDQSFVLTCAIHCCIILLHNALLYCVQLPCTSAGLPASGVVIHCTQCHVISGFFPWQDLCLSGEVSSYFRPQHGSLIEGESLAVLGVFILQPKRCDTLRFLFIDEGLGILIL